MVLVFIKLLIRWDIPPAWFTEARAGRVQPPPGWNIVHPASSCQPPILVKVCYLRHTKFVGRWISTQQDVSSKIRYVLNRHSLINKMVLTTELTCISNYLSKTKKHGNTILLHSILCLYKTYFVFESFVVSSISVTFTSTQILIYKLRYT